MPPPAIAPVLDGLRETPLLSAAQLEEVEGALQEQFPEPRELTAELVRRGWLTPFQRDGLLMGKARDLLLGPYLILARLGQGGMGVVYKARHQLLNRVVALKVAYKDVLQDTQGERRFLREMQATAQLSHPNIVVAYDALRVDGAHLFAMEYVDGTDLGRLVKDSGPLPVAQACDYIRQAALGLQHAHERGMVHRDIKPSNLLLSAEGSLVKISDMGLVRGGLGPDDGQLTSTGIVIGTPDYLAPEQATNAKGVDIRADLYSLGCTFYHLLTGQPPFPDGTPLEKLFKHVEQTPTPIQELQPDVPPELATVVHRLMAKKPVDRYQTPAAVALALEPFCQRAAERLHPTDTPPDVPVPPKPAKTVVDVRPTVALMKPSGPANAPASAGETPAASPAAAPSPTAVEPPKPPPAQAPAPPAPAAEPKPARSRRCLVLAAVGILLLGGAGLAYWHPWSPSQGAASKPPITNSLGMQLAWIPAGDFTMGSPSSEPGHREDESPTHHVVISRPFYLATRETTVAQFRAFVKAMHYQTDAEKGSGAKRWDANERGWKLDQQCTWKNPGWEPADEEPVVCVSQFDALAFCFWLEKREGKKYRLPTEAEWEYACRAGTTTPFAWGPGLSPSQANFAPPGGSGHMGRVGLFAANPWGLQDMHGNAWEWCADRYRPTYYHESPERDPTGPEKADYAVVRGGSCFSGGSDCRAAARLGVALGERRNDIGFRVVREAGVR